MVLEGREKVVLEGGDWISTLPPPPSYYAEGERVRVEEVRGGRGEGGWWGDEVRGEVREEKMG